MMLSNLAREMVAKAEYAELDSINIAYGKKFASKWETESVIREHITTVEENLAEVKKQFDDYYCEAVRLIETSANTRVRLSMLYNALEKLAQTSVQTMAICDKAIITVTDENIRETDLIS